MRPHLDCWMKDLQEDQLQCVGPGMRPRAPEGGVTYDDSL